MIREQRDARLGSLAFYKSVLDALEANIAVLDQYGTILAVNTSWERFGKANGIRDSRFGVGVNYYAVCRAAVDPVARAAASGIRDVLHHRRPSFDLEYPCHSPDEERWFKLRATPLPEHPGFAVVAHENITERVIADRASTPSPTIEQLDLVVSAFPGCWDRIEALIAEPPAFLEICEQYQELATRINELRRTEGDAELLEESEELLEFLARQIRQFLAEPLE